MTRTFTTAIILILFLAACKTPGKAFDRGDYESAVEQAVKKLAKDPADDATQKLLQEAYKQAVARREEGIRNLLASSGANRFEQAFQQYQSLQSLYTTVKQNPASANAVPAVDYASYVETYRNKAAETRMERGMQYMDEGTKRSYREAYHEFAAAQRIKPGNPEIKRLVEQSYELAVVNVLVVPMNIFESNYYYSNTSYQMRNFQDRIIRDLNYSTTSEFVRYISEWDARSADIRPDEILEMRFGRIRIGQPYDRTETRKVEKQVVIKETVYSKDSVAREYATVRAQIHTTYRTLVSTAAMLLTTRDGDGRIIWTDEFGGEHRWQVTRVTYTGDERALSDADKVLINKPADQRVPREDEIVDNLLGQIQDELKRRLRYHYQRSF